MNVSTTPNNEKTRPGWHRNGSVSNTEESTPMLNPQVTVLIERAATESLTLPAEPTMLAAPNWATVSTIDGAPVDNTGVVSHDHESPVRFGVESDLTGHLLTRCAVTLSQADYLNTDGFSVVNTDRQGATVNLLLPDGMVNVPVDEARVLHAVVGGLLARYDSATSPATPSRVAGPWPCLPGCDENHKPDAPAHECHSYSHIGVIQTDVPTIKISVDAIAYSENADTIPTVVVERNDIPQDYASQMSSGQARELAALMLTAADKADALTVRPAATTSPAGA